MRCRRALKAERAKTVNSNGAKMDSLEHWSVKTRSFRGKRLQLPKLKRYRLHRPWPPAIQPRHEPRAKGRADLSEPHHALRDASACCVVIEDWLVTRPHTGNVDVNLCVYVCVHI